MGARKRSRNTSQVAVLAMVAMPRLSVGTR
jgi:hypothetical protein